MANANSCLKCGQQFSEATQRYLSGHPVSCPSCGGHVTLEENAKVTTSRRQYRGDLSETPGQRDRIPRKPPKTAASSPTPMPARQPTSPKPTLESRHEPAMSISMAPQLELRLEQKQDKPYVGQTGMLEGMVVDQPSLLVMVRVVDFQVRENREVLLVEPVAGHGQVWVDKMLIRFETT